VKKFALLAVVALSLLVSVGTAGADGARSPQDQAFLNTLAQAPQAPAAPAIATPAQLCLGNVGTPPVSQRACAGAACTNSKQCCSGPPDWACRGGHCEAN
jgi:hypothetical protein